MAPDHPRTTSTATPQRLNGFDLAELEGVANALSSDPNAGVVEFEIESTWRGQALIEHRTAHCSVGGKIVERTHTIVSDEPLELFGTDNGPNPQELLLSALNGCMLFIYLLKAASMGIEVRSLSMRSSGSLDLRGSLRLAELPPGFGHIDYDVVIDADASPEQLEALHDIVRRDSPNAYHLLHAIALRRKAR